MKCPLFLAVFGLAFSCFSAAPPPDKLLPGDTLAMFTAPDYAKARAITHRWPGSQLWSDVAMKPFVDKLVGKFKSELVTPLEREFGVNFSDFADLAQGQLTFALTQGGGGDDKQGQTPGLLLLVDTKDKSDLLKTNLTSLKKKWIDSGKQVRNEKIRDVEFTTFIFSSDDFSKTIEKAFPDPNTGNETLEAPKAKKTAKKVELLLGQSGSLFVMGNSMPDIEKVLIRQSGGGVPSLSEQSSFNSSYDGHFRDALSYGWINFKTILDLLIKQAGADNGPNRNPMMPKPDKILSAVGLTGVRSLSFDVKDAADGWLMDFQLAVPEAERRGLIKLIAGEAKDSAPPPFVPADVVKFTRYRIDLQKAWATLESIVNELSPPMGATIKAAIDVVGKDKDPDFDLRKNLIANFGDDVITYQKSPKEQTFTALLSPPTLYLVSSPKAEQLAAAVKALTSLMPQPGKMKEREFLGRKVYTMSLPGGGGGPRGRGGKAGEATTLSYTASGGYVAISTDNATLEEFLRGNTEKPLRETPGLSEAAQKIGGLGTGLFSFQNDKESMRNMLETARKESGSIANFVNAIPWAGRFLDEDSKKFKDWVDFSLLPSFDKISKYFNYTISSGSANSQGLELKMFGPNSPQFRN